MTNSQITSVGNLIETIGQFSESQLMFRGQSQDWPLLPSIGRFECNSFASNWRDFHEYVIERFLRAGAPYFRAALSRDVEKWVFAQHHGLPTRLLDTALNPLKAMHFVVGDPREDKYDGVFWIFEHNSWREELDEKYRKYWDSEITAFLPAQIHPRLTAQEGAFICYPLPDNADPLPSLDQLPETFGEHAEIKCHRFLVAAENKKNLRREIYRLGARNSLLFPDLDGVAREIALDLHEQDE